MKTKNYLVRLKLLTVSALAAASVHAQTSILFQNFQASQTTIPAGWTQQRSAADPTNGGWKFGSSFSGTLAANYIPGHGYYALVDDYDNNTSVAANWDTLYTPAFSCAGKSHVFVSFDYLTLVTIPATETSNIAISTNNGKTWTTMTGNFADTQGAWQDSVLVDISSYAANQSNVMLAFTYFDGVPNQDGYPGGALAISNVDVFEPLQYNVTVASQNLSYLLQVGTPYTFSGMLTSFGGDTINSLHLNYQINGGALQTDNITGITNFYPLTSYNYTHNKPFTPPVTGGYTVKIWVDNIDGNNADQNASVDTLTATFMAVSAIQPKKVLLEEFGNASCNPCMIATPNIDSVAANNQKNCNPVRYHVDFPKRDFMDDETWSSFVDSRTFGYYGISGVPAAELDGQSIYPEAGYLTSASIQQEMAVGSPFSISINATAYDISTNTFSISADITAYGNFPAGLSARVALTVDTISYKLDQSQEDPQIYFQPPIGEYPAVDGGISDDLYPGLLHFPYVAEAMMPSSSGTTLEAFTNGSNQTINLSWKVNHSWGSNSRGNNKAIGDTSIYDSTKTVHFTVFLQDNNGEPALGVPAKYVYQSASSSLDYITGIQEISNGISFGMYPNPAKGSTNIIYDITQEQNVSVDVYNLLGERVYSENLGRSAAGKHTYTVSGQGLRSGIYLIKFTAGNASTTQRLVLQQ
jgi:hypothetical protein